MNAITLSFSFRPTERRRGLITILLVFLASLVATLGTAYGQQANLGQALKSPLIAGQLPAAYELLLEKDHHVLTLVGVSQGDISGVTVGDQFFRADELRIVDERDAEIGNFLEMRIPLTVEGETIYVSFANGATLALPKSVRSAPDLDSQKAGAAPTLFLTMGSAKIFPKGSTTVTVTAVGGRVGDTYVLSPLASTKGITIVRLDSRSFVVSGNAIGNYSVQAIAYRGSIKIGQSPISSVTVVSPKGWSSDTGYKYPAAGSVTGKMLSAANAAVGQRSGQSIFCSGIACGYFTDVAGGDGARIRAAIATKVNWVGTNTALRDARMRQNLTGSRDPYTAGTITALVNRINSTVTVVPADSDQGVLNALGIQAQCAEWVQTLAFKSGAGIPQGMVVSDRSLVAPGFGVTNVRHTALVADVEYDGAGAPTNYRVIDANYNNVWSNPPGDIAWDRRVRKAPISERGGIGAYDFRSYTGASVPVGTPK